MASAGSRDAVVNRLLVAKSIVVPSPCRSIMMCESQVSPATVPNCSTSLLTDPSLLLNVKDPVSSITIENSQLEDTGVVDIVFPTRNPNVVPTVIDPEGIKILSPADVTSVV